MAFLIYKARIRRASSASELYRISYEAFLKDSSPHKGNSLSNIVDRLCFCREAELGLR